VLVHAFIVYIIRAMPAAMAAVVVLHVLVVAMVKG